MDLTRHLQSKFEQQANDEMRKYHIGRNVLWRFMGRPRGEIIEQDPPFGLGAPRYRVRWISGDMAGTTSEWMYAHDLLLDI